MTNEGGIPSIEEYICIDDRGNRGSLFFFRVTSQEEGVTQLGCESI